MLLGLIYGVVWADLGRGGKILEGGGPSFIFPRPNLN